VVRTNQVDDEHIPRRTTAFESDQALTPPWLLTSDGAAIAGSEPNPMFGSRTGRPTFGLSRGTKLHRSVRT